MSTITDVILLTAIDDGRDHLDEINAWLAKEFQGRIDRVDGDIGPPAFQAECFLGAFRWMTGEEDRLVSYIKSLVWEYPESVHLLIKREYDDKFSFINITETESVDGPEDWIYLTPAERQEAQKKLNQFTRALMDNAGTWDRPENEENKT